MLAFKFLFSFLIFFLGKNSFAVSNSLQSFSLNYVSWVEFLDLEMVGAQADGFAQFYGNSLAYERESYDETWGHSFEAAAMTGVANGGETGLALTYQQANIKWSGASASIKYGYKPNENAAILLGPMVLFRHVSWPEQGTVSAKSGRSTNLGAVFAIKVRPTQRLELTQELGNLFMQAATYWSFGLGYQF